MAKLLIKPHAAYEKIPHRPGRWHICLLSGDARIAHAGEQYTLQAGNSLSLDVQREITIRNSGNNNLFAIVTH